MEELINLLQEYFKKDTKFHTREEIKKILNVKGEEKDRILSEALLKLEEKGIVFYDKKKGYKVFPNTSGFAYGTLEINKSGVGFVHTNNGYTILIENRDLNGALDGDIVIVNDIFDKRKDYYGGSIYKILKRKNGNIIFEVIGNGTKATLVPYNINQNVNVDFNVNQLKNLSDGELILVNVGCNQEYGSFKGDIVKTIGYKNDPNIDIKLIFEEHNIPIEFSDQAIQEAIKMPKSVRSEEFKNRVDLRDENIFTIDCDDTKDRDDAVGVKKLSNGNYLLKVNIAHVSHYIKEDSELFKEALSRCFSHYLCNSCNPMLHYLVSNGICSLNENVDRLTKTIEMEINQSGEVIDYKIYNSVINSKKAMSYSSVNKTLNGNIIDEYSKYYYDLKLMEELNSILETSKNKRNYLNFNTTELKVIKNNQGDILEFKKNDLGLAGQIIENFMLLANTTIYKHFAWFILAYRIHEAPNEERIKETISILKASNIRLPKLNNYDSRSLKTLINNLEDNELSEIIRECLLRSMKKARYDTTNLGHFALQYDTYGHFTSPIRRIIDLITHMTIDNIENFDYSEESMKEFELFLNNVCNKANEIEKIGKVMEQEAMEMAMAKYMKDHIGEEYEVIVTEINRYAMFVRTKNLIRGKIKFSDMLDDQYYYNPEKRNVIGRNSKKIYHIGSKLVVIAKDANTATRTVNFELPKAKVLKK